MTQEDANVLIEYIRADVEIIVRKTELWTQETTENYLFDIEQFIKNGYASHIDIIMKGSLGDIIRCNRYVIKQNIKSNKQDRPGNIDWDDLGGTSLNIFILFSEARKKLNDYEIDNFYSKLKSSWSSAAEDTKLPYLNKNISKNFSSTDSYIQRIDYDNGNK